MSPVYIGKCSTIFVGVILATELSECALGGVTLRSMGMQHLYTAQEVRSAEHVLLSVESQPDQLMRLAAGHVARIAKGILPEVGSALLEDLWDSDKQRVVVLLVGPGGNGGDALYAGAELLETGYQVVAFSAIPGRQVKETARETFEQAGGSWVEELPIGPEAMLVIDGIAGLGSSRGLSEHVAEFLADVNSFKVPIVAIDVPTGVAADTGVTPPDITVQCRGYTPEDAMWATQRVPAHVKATVTVTFGGLRYAHALSPWCGRVELVDLNLPNRRLKDDSEAVPAVPVGEPIWLSQQLWRNSKNPPNYWEPLASANISVGARATISGKGSCTLPDEGNSGERPLLTSVEPGPFDHKYSGGVTDICAGSEAFPGAGILAALGAIRASSSAVRLLNPPPQVVSFAPEALISTGSINDFLPSTPTTSSPDALVIGPGRGTGDEQTEELAAALRSNIPLVVDADALTLLANNDELLQSLRGREAFTLLTPHAGEFSRIAPEGVPDPTSDPVEAARRLAVELGCAILLKGRSSVLASPTSVNIINAGSSWAATPGSGDVLAGILGAYVARAVVEIQYLKHLYPALYEPADSRDCVEWSSQLEHVFLAHVRNAVGVHAVAAFHAAITEFPAAQPASRSLEIRQGYAPVTASQIARAISSATAALSATKGKIAGQTGE